jgi:hypothetical protein
MDGLDKDCQTSNAPLSTWDSFDSGSGISLFDNILFPAGASPSYLSADWELHSSVGYTHRTQSQSSNTSKTSPGRNMPLTEDKTIQNTHIDKSGLLPSTTQIIELLDLFFDQYHFFIPCIHRLTLLDRVKQGRGISSSSPLLWAILSIAAPSHPDPHLQGLQSSWLTHARGLFDKNIMTNTVPTQFLQAAVCLIFHYYISSDVTGSWFFLGKACRLAIILGADHSDSTREPRIVSFLPKPQDSIEMEEQRKSMWLLVYFDRYMSSLAGFPLAIDDRMYHVNFPIDDKTFQDFSGSFDETYSIQFTTDLDSLVEAVISNKPNQESLSIRHVFLGSVIMGRIMTFYNNLHHSPDSIEYQTEIKYLQHATEALISFTQSQERYLGNYTKDIRNHMQYHRLYLWLLSISSTCKILLYHPMASSSQLPCPTPPHDTSSASEPSEPTGFTECVQSIRQVVNSFKQANPATASDNPFLITTYFLCSRFLATSWLQYKVQSDRDDVDFLLTLVDRLGDKWPALAKKFRKAMMRDLVSDAEESRRMMIGTGTYLNAECT